MAIRIPWNEQEKAILMDSLADVLQKKVDRKAAIQKVSKKLREMAVENGIVIDEKYRNENGIALQMGKLEYVFTRGKSGIQTEAGWYFDIVELYENRQKEFEQTLLNRTDTNSMENAKVFKKPLQTSDQKKEINKKIRECCTAYIKWMGAQGINRTAIHSFLMALNQCDSYVLEKQLTQKSLYLTVSVSDLGIIKKKLFEEDILFKSFNEKMNQRFQNALDKYIEFCAAMENDRSVRQPKSIEQEMPAVTEQPDEKYLTILKNYFPDGLRQNVIHIKKFIRNYEEQFQEEVKIERDELLLRLRSIGVVREGRIYARNSDEQSSFMKGILADIAAVFKNGATCIYFSMILQRYGQQLGEKLNVYNEDTLKALLMEYMTNHDCIHNHYISKSGVQADVTVDVLRFMQNRYEPVTYDEMQTALWYLPMGKIKQALMKIPSIVNIAQGTYLYVPNIQISADEQQILIHAIQSEIEQRGFLVGRHLKALVEKFCPSFAIDTSFMKDWGLRNVIGYMLRDYFEFQDAVIVNKGQQFSIADAYQHFCMEREKMTLYQLEEFSANINVPISWENVFSVMIRISATEFIRDGNVHFDSDAVDSILDTFCPGEYIPIREIGLYLQFPAIEIPWNGFVLECYLKKYSKRFRLDQANVTKSGYYGVIVRRNSLLQNYEQVVIDTLARSLEWNNEESALELLVSHGYQARRRWTDFSSIIKQVLLKREQLENEGKRG